MNYGDHNFIEITQQTKLRIALVVSSRAKWNLRYLWSEYSYAYCGVLPSFHVADYFAGECEGTSGDAKCVTETLGDENKKVGANF